MKKIACIFSLLILLISTSALARETEDELVVLCYHHISEQEPNDNLYTISRKTFMQQLEFLRAHQYHFVSVQDVLDARAGRKALPAKPVLLSFDDGYQSFYDFVFPVLKELGYPAMLAVVGDWLDNKPPEDLPAPLMSWREIEEISRSGLVEIASHSYGHHKALMYTPEGNVAAGITVRQYFPQAKRYESEEEYRNRLRLDFQRQNQAIESHTGKRPRAMVWPYGRYNTAAIELAKEAGLPLCFNLDLHQKDRGLRGKLGLSRLIIDNESVDVFSYHVRWPLPPMDPIRAVQVDLDQIYDPQSPRITEQNLDKLIERLVALGVNTVFLQAFCDLDGSGNISSVYFHNRVLPVKADIFGHAAHQISIRGIRVFAWMPSLSFVFPDQSFNERFAVRANEQGGTGGSWYKRLTPFSDEVLRKVGMLYEDLAIHTQISGILFQDDAYLNDYEDIHPLALDAFSAKTGRQVRADELLENEALQQEWTAYKETVLNKFIATLGQKALAYRPDLYLARNIYANVLIHPESETWFAQNYRQFLQQYDFTVIMAYPQMEETASSIPWLKQLVHQALQQPGDEDKTIFKIQAYDWHKEEWLSSDILLKEMKAVLSTGARHLAYYPDDLFKNIPDLDTAKLEMSTHKLPR